MDYFLVVVLYYYYKVIIIKDNTVFSLSASKYIVKKLVFL